MAVPSLPAGRTEVRRIVSLLPAATEIVAALGAWDRLVGVSHECDEPTLARHLPRVTSTRIDPAASPADVDAAVSAASASGNALFSLDADRIRSLAPDLIISQGVCDVCAIGEADVRAIAATIAPQPAVLTLSAARLDDVLGDIALVADALDATDEKAELLSGIRYRMLGIHRRLKAAGAPRPRVAVLEWTDPLYAGGHWIPDMIRRAGGLDVLASPGDPSRRVTVTELQAARPDVVIIAGCGHDAERSAAEGRALLATSEWDWVAPIPVWSMDGNALTSRPGPRLCEGVEAMARVFNPTLFSPVAPHHARLLNPA